MIPNTKSAKWSSDASVVQATGLIHQYKDIKALDGITVEVPKGRVTGVIGPDGVGKSTFLGVISGARKLQQGKLFVLQADMHQRQQRERNYARIAYMPQGLGRNLYPTLSVFENIDFFAKKKCFIKIIRERFKKLITSHCFNPIQV